MKRVLVTGASGFIGRHVIGPLTASGHEVHATTSLMHRTGDGNSKSVVWHPVDLLAAGEATRLIAALRPSHLLHLAWYAKPGHYWRSSANLEWLAASLELLRAFGDSGGRRIVMAGTCAEYDWTHGYCTERVTPLVPNSLYGACKNALAGTLEAYAAQHHLSSAWARLFFLYGPGEPAEKLVPSVIRALLEGRAADCTHGRQLRDFLHVADVGEALCALLTSAVEGPVNLASGQPLALHDIVLEIGRQLERPELVRLGALAAPEFDPPLVVGNPTRLHSEVGWQPRRELVDGIGEAIAWWRHQPPQRSAT